MRFSKEKITLLKKRWDTHPLNTSLAVPKCNLLARSAKERTKNGAEFLEDLMRDRKFISHRLHLDFLKINRILNNGV